MDIQLLIRNNIKGLKPYASARDEFKDFKSSMVFLDANENPFENGVNRYPDPQQTELKSIISTIKNVPTKNMLFGNGSDEVLDLIFRVFCEPNVDNIITLPPTYSMYEVLANLNAIEIIKVELSNTFQPQFENILKATNANSKILFLCSPNNPTGNSFNTNEVEKLLINFPGIVVIDEAYIDFSETKSWLNRLDEFPNLIITQTVSKAYGLAGIRLGTCFASEEIIATLNKIKPPYNVNELTQQRAIRRLKEVDEVNEEISLIKKLRQSLIIELEAIGFIKFIYPTDANFILIKVDNALKRYNELIKKGIVIRNRTHQPGCKNTLRLTVGTKTENEKLITALKQIL